MLAIALQSRVSEVLHVDIHPAAQLGSGVLIDHATGVVIGETAVVGNNVSMLHHVTLGGSGTGKGIRHPTIGTVFYFLQIACNFKKRSCLLTCCVMNLFCMTCILVCEYCVKTCSYGSKCVTGESCWLHLLICTPYLNVLGLGLLALAMLFRSRNLPAAGDGALLGAGVSVLGPIRVGAGCKVGAGSVVVKELPDYCVAVGVPARIIKQLQVKREPSIDMDQCDDFILDYVI